jgi:hypothetical protein
MSLKRKEIDGNTNFDKVLFTSPIWKSMLNCFDILKAIDIEVRFGSQVISWYMQQQSFIPCAETWESAINIRCSYEYIHSDKFSSQNSGTSCGMLLYLIKFEVVCPKLNELVQFCVDNNRITELLILLHPEHKFRNRNGEFYKIRKHPHLDLACRRGFITIVQIIMHLFPQTPELCLLHFIDKTLEETIQVGRYDILELIVPNLTRIRKPDALIAAVKNIETRERFKNVYDDQKCESAAANNMDNNSIALSELFEFCLDNAISHSLLIEEVLLSIVRLSNHQIAFKLLHLCLSKSAIMTQKIWDTAFTYNNLLIIEAFPEFKITDKLLIDVCRAGHCDLIAKLDDSVKLPKECILSSIRSGNASLIHLISKKVDNVIFTKSMLLESISRTNHFIDPNETDLVKIDPTVATFYCGNFTSIDTTIICELIKHDRQTTLKYFKEMDDIGGFGWDIFNDTSFLQASETCNTAIMEMMLSDTNIIWKESTLREALRLVYTSKNSVEKRQIGIKMIEATRKLLIKM